MRRDGGYRWSRPKATAITHFSGRTAAAEVAMWGRRGGWVKRNLLPSKCPVQVAWGSVGLFGWGCNSSEDFLPDPPCLVENTKNRPTQTCPELTWHVQWSSLPGASSASGVPPKLALGGVLSDTKPNTIIRYLVGGSFSGRFPEMGGAASPPI